MGQGIFEDQLGARVRITLAQLGEMNFGQPRDPLINLHLAAMLHIGMRQHLAQGAAIATTHDQHPFRVRM